MLKKSEYNGKGDIDLVTLPLELNHFDGCWCRGRVAYLYFLSIEMVCDNAI